MKRTVIIVAAALVLVAVIAAGIAFFLMQEPAPPEGRPNDPFGNIPSSGIGSEPTGPIVIRDYEGLPVSVPDFKSGRTAIEFGGDTYYNLLEGTPLADGNSPFSLQFSDYPSLFSIVLVSEPLGEARLSAERYMRELLQLPDADICRLNIVVGVDGDVNPVYAEYEDLGLSFCTTPVPLP